MSTSERLLSSSAEPNDPEAQADARSCRRPAWRRDALLALQLVVLAAATAVYAYLRFAILKTFPSYVDIPSLGRIKGITYPTARFFLGIPFGVAGRFESPRLAPSWKGRILDARHYKAACMHPSGIRKEGVSEDCLFLNIFTPTWGVGQKPNPVLVWLHGGGYTVGAGSDTSPEDVQMLVKRHKLVVVSINYRLGFFGFAGSDDLRSPMDNSTGNFGIQDQRLALEWVQRYIQYFGGDPHRVTLIGWSAGAASISVHLASPKSRGLFHRAIMMSGGFTDWAALPLGAAEQAFSFVASCLGCLRTDRVCLSEKKAEEVMSCASGQWIGPVVDGVDLPRHPLEAMRAGDSSVLDFSITITIGCTLLDKLMDIGRHATEDKLRQVVAAELQNQTSVERAMSLYPARTYQEDSNVYLPQWSAAYWRAREMFADRDFTCVMRAVVAEWTRQNQAAAFWYSWVQPQVYSEEALFDLEKQSDLNDVKLKGSCYPCPGAGHGADLAFLFENPEKTDVDGLVEKGDALTRNLQSFYVDFAWTGQVDQSGEEAAIKTEALPIWDPFTLSRGNAMVFVAGKSHQIEHYREEKCNFWSHHQR